MKRILLVLLAVMLVGSVAMAQSMAKTGQWGVQTAIGAAYSAGGPGGGLPNAPTIGAKFLVSDNVAIRVEAGILSASASGGGGSLTGYGVGAGFEYHIGGGKGSVSPYVGLGVGYAGGSTPAGGTTPTSLTVAGVFGGEYFFSSNFSWAGQIGVGFNTTGVSGATTTTIATTGTMDAIFTWYIN